MYKVFLNILLVLMIIISNTEGVILYGPLTVGLCYTACNAGYVACMSAAGLTAGVSVATTGPVGWWAWMTGAPAAAAACSAIQGACMAACTTTVVAPTP
mmetsp:Transcript_64221/g.78523  ORF Transcript_64221/g.78523 Transcript_64221/m.78523 type:complete len:99 (+) Transcript_64221:100-396(+)